MRVLVCFSVVKDLDVVQAEEWQACRGNLNDLSYCRTILNCYDEAALELAARLGEEAQEHSIDFEMDAVTIGPEQNDSFAKSLFAVGFNKVTAIRADDLGAFSPLRIASILAAYEESNASHNLILLGKQKSIGDNAVTPIALAQRLKRHYLGNVFDMHLLSENNVSISRTAQNEVILEKASCPLVISISNTSIAHLRVPTLKERLRNKNRLLEELIEEDIQNNKTKPNVQSDKTNLVSLDYCNQTKVCKMLQGNDAAEMVDLLYELSFKDHF